MPVSQPHETGDLLTHALASRHLPSLVDHVASGRKPLTFKHPFTDRNLEINDSEMLVAT